jgi:hypothetical protein
MIRVRERDLMAREECSFAFDMFASLFLSLMDCLEESGVSHLVDGVKCLPKGSFVTLVSARRNLLVMLSDVDDKWYAHIQKLKCNILPLPPFCVKHPILATGPLRRPVFQGSVQSAPGVTMKPVLDNDIP